MTPGSREAIVDAARSLHRDGMNIGTAGNLSARDGNGMLITPSALDYREMDKEDIVYVSPGGDPQGRRTPSSEWRFHLAIYQSFPDAHAIVHTHSTYATALACLNRDLPAFHYEVALAGGADIRCAPYATFGTPDLALNVVRALESRTACLLANHGLVCHASNLKAALALAQKIEQLSKIYLQCLAAGEAALLDEGELARVMEKFRDYSQSG